MHRDPSPAFQHSASAAELADLRLDKLHAEPSPADIAIAGLRQRHTVSGYTGHAALCESYEALIRSLFKRLEVRS